jgi:hypothetical protein
MLWMSLGTLRPCGGADCPMGSSRCYSRLGTIKQAKKPLWKEMRKQQALQKGFNPRVLGWSCVRSCVGSSILSCFVVYSAQYRGQLIMQIIPFKVMYYSDLCGDAEPLKNAPAVARLRGSTHADSPGGPRCNAPASSYWPQPGPTPVPDPVRLVGPFARV